jgi:hypothetical protein
VDTLLAVKRYEPGYCVQSGRPRTDRAISGSIRKNRDCRIGELTLVDGPRSVSILPKSRIDTAWAESGLRRSRSIGSRSAHLPDFHKALQRAAATKDAMLRPAWSFGASHARRRRWVLGRSTGWPRSSANGIGPRVINATLDQRPVQRQHRFGFPVGRNARSLAGGKSNVRGLSVECRAKHDRD